jgi:hypothetical protein
MKRIKRKQWKKKITPSGYWDNGVWEFSNEVVSFPNSVLENAVIAEKLLKISSLNNSSVKAFEVTHGNKSWVVDKNPLDLTC